jgi:hydrogenase nickel incorporation protein HypA/HybF
MHETSVVANLIELIHEQLSREGAVRVTAVHLAVGPLAGVAVDALRFAFDAAAPGTIIDGACLEIVTPPLTAWCRTCLATRELTDASRLVCPVCRQPTPDVTGGRELELERLEVLDLVRLPEPIHAV